VRSLSLALATPWRGRHRLADASPRHARPGLPLLACLGLLAAPGPAAAQEATTVLPGTIVTATRIPTPAERVPASVTVITRRDIEERGYQTLAEALTEVPGMRLVPPGGVGQQPTSAFVRGSNSDQVLVLLDGVPINDAASPGGAFDFGQDLLFDIERIEVVRGPLSTLYGSAAIGGTVNLITRRARPDRAFAPYGEIAGGGQRTLRAGAGATGTLGMVDYLVSGQSLSTQGTDATPRRFLADTGEFDGYRGAFATARLGVTPRPGTRIEALLRWQQTNTGFDNVPNDDPNASAENRRWFGQLRGETQLFDGLWTTGLRVFATEDRRRSVNPPDGLNRGGEDALFRGTRTGIDWGNSLRLPGAGPLTDGALGFGVTHLMEEAQSDQLFTSSFGNFGQGVRANQHTTAGFATLQYRLWERLDLTAGLRHDAVTGVEGATTWRVGAALAVPEIGTRFRAAVGTAFRAPSLFQRFGITAFGGFITPIGNPDLKPERSTGWEIGADTDVAAFGRPRFATTSWTYFNNRVRDGIVNVFGPAGSRFVNVDRLAIQGAELGLTLRPHPRLETTANWTITESFDDVTDRRLLRRPEHVVSVTARVVPVTGLVIAPTVLFTGRANDVVYANDGRFLGRGVDKSGTVVNLTATWQAAEFLAVFAEARNLTNARYEPANGFVIPGRNLLIGTRFAL
jgi:vitamin B12 transporter